MKRIVWYILCAVLCMTLLGVAYIYTLQPSNDRERVDRDAVLATSEMVGDQITIRNIRNFTRRDDKDYDKNFYDKTFDIKDVVSVEYFLSTFARKEKIGHTFLSFGLSDGSQIPISIEARKEVGEEYTPLKGLGNQYELAYVIADEQDMISLRTQVRDDPVYRYDLAVSAEQAQDLLLSLLDTSNTLATEPMFYNTIAHNCTSVLRRHANKVSPGVLGLNIGLILTGESDYYLYDQGYIQTDSAREQLRIDHRINEKVASIVGQDDFSVLLRE